MMIQKNQKGFTLVELIVVIAIIAILAAVSIVGFTSFIENARISNDNNLASQMTKLVQAHIQGTGETDLDAHDVRTIVTDNSGEQISFTPQTEGGIFVYVEETHKVMFAMVDDIISGAVLLKHNTATELLSSNLDLQEDIGDTPEEIFGEDTFVLSMGGSTIAEVTWGFRALATSSTLDYDYTALETLAGTDDRLNGFLDLFTLDNTLFVNNNDWPNLPSSSVAPFTRILFQAGIRNIPSMNNSSHVRLTVETTIVLPSTVKSIEEAAFSKVLLKPGESFDLTKTNDVTVETDAFSDDQITDYALSISEGSFNTLGTVAKYWDGASWKNFGAPQNLTSETEVKFDITGTPRTLIDQIVIQRVNKADGTYYIIRAYNDTSGLLGKDEFKVIYTD